MDGLVMEHVHGLVMEHVHGLVMEHRSWPTVHVTGLRFTSPD